MEPKRLGRTLGIGMRVAGGMLRDHAGQATQRTAQAARVQAPAYAEKGRVAATKGRELGQGIGRGTRNFSRSFFGPLAHAGSVLWLEITGLFFALFGLFFAQNVYHFRGAWRSGPEHTHFVLYAALTLLFGWFCASSFLRARKKSRTAR